MRTFSLALRLMAMADEVFQIVMGDLVWRQIENVPSDYVQNNAWTVKMKDMVTDRHYELTADKFNLYLNNALSQKEIRI